MIKVNAESLMAVTHTHTRYVYKTSEIEEKYMDNKIRDGSIAPKSRHDILVSF